MDPVDPPARTADLRASLRDVDPAPLPDEADRFGAGKRSRIASVAAILRPSGDDLELLLIRRAERAGDVWSGHVALPGGRREPEDASAVAVAVRETREEVAVDLDAPGARLLGALPPLEPSNPALPQITVLPFVWLVDDADPRTSDEVAAVQWVSLAHLRLEEHRIEHRITVPDGTERSFPGVALGEDVLWGMTHHIVHTLLDALERPAQAGR